MSRFRLFLRGLGSVMDIWPRTNYRRYISQETPEERMRHTWERVGQGIARAMEKVEEEQKR